MFVAVVTCGLVRAFAGWMGRAGACRWGLFSCDVVGRVFSDGFLLARWVVWLDWYMADSGVRGGFVLWSRRGVMLLGVGVLVGCGDVGEDRSQLPVLLEDPLAAKDLLGLPLKDGFESGYQRPLGKPKFTEVKRVFSLGDADRQEIFDRAVAFAKDVGWENKYESSLPPNMIWDGRKKNPRRDCGVFIADNDTADLIVILEVVERP